MFVNMVAAFLEEKSAMHLWNIASVSVWYFVLTLYAPLLFIKKTSRTSFHKQEAMNDSGEQKQFQVKDNRVLQSILDLFIPTILQSMCWGMIHNIHAVETQTWITSPSTL
jgi:Ca2+/Na+ antiporter